MSVESMLGERIGMAAVRHIADWARPEAGNRSRLLELTRSANRREAVNALWVLTHLQSEFAEWFQSEQNRLIDMLLSETDASKRRMLLQILRNTEFNSANPRADFLDYCLDKITSECEPYAVRANCIHIAFKLSCGYRELLAELGRHLEMLSFQSLSPGLKSALRQTQRLLAAMGQSSE